MLIKLPIEVWRDCFEWLSPKDRKQLARKLNDIDDYEFSYLCQKWLHEWTKNVCLGELRIIDSATEFGVACAYLSCVNILRRGERDNPEEFPIAETELPDNITDLKTIEISYLDTRVLQFLRRLQPLFRNVTLDVDCKEQWYKEFPSNRAELKREATRTTLVHLLPLLTGGIETVRICHSRFCLELHDLCTDQQFFGMKKIEIFDAFNPMKELSNELIKLLLLWLHTRHDDGRYRFLRMPNFHANPLELIAPIRQHFINATNAVSFCINLSKWNGGEAYDDVHESIQNAGTQEQLLVRQWQSNILLIGRCSSEEDGERWIEEKGFESFYVHERRINFFNPTIGSLEEEPMLQLEEEAEDGEEDVNQPGPSSKMMKFA